MKRVMLIAFAIVGGATVGPAERQVTFEQDAVGRPPAGFTFGHTAKIGAPGKWVVQQEGAGRA